MFLGLGTQEENSNSTVADPLAWTGGHSHKWCQAVEHHYGEQVQGEEMGEKGTVVHGLGRKVDLKRQGW